MRKEVIEGVINLFPFHSWILTDNELIISNMKTQDKNKFVNKMLLNSNIIICTNP